VYRPLMIDQQDDDGRRALIHCFIRCFIICGFICSLFLGPSACSHDPALSQQEEERAFD
jgi:hypothetical protein